MGEGYDSFLSEIQVSDDAEAQRYVDDMMGKPHVIVSISHLDALAGMEERYSCGMSIAMAGKYGLDDPSSILAALEMAAQTLRDTGVKLPWEN